MSRKTRSFLITLILLFCVVAAFVVVRMRGDEEVPVVETPEIRTVVLSEFSSANLRSVLVKNADGGVHLFSSDGAEWKVADTPQYYRLDSAGAISAVRYFSRVQGQEIEGNADPSRLAEFGLDEPIATVTLRDKDGNSTVLEFGSMSPSGAGRFGRRSDSNAIALIPAHITRAAMATPAAFRDISLPTVNLQAMVGFSYRSGDDVFIAEPRSASNPFVTNAGPFEVVAPFRGRYGMNDYALSKILTETSPLPTVVRKWSDESDPSDPALGLDEETADYINIVDAEGGALSLRIGASDGNGNRYAMLADRDEAVFLLAEFDVALLNTRPFDLLDKFIFLANIIEVSQVKVEKSGDTLFMSRKGLGNEEDSKDDNFYVNDLPIDHEDFTSVYQKFIGLMWEGEIQERKTLEFPEVRITVSHDTPGVENVIIRFWAYDDTYYQATVGDNPLEFLVGRYQVDLFLDELSALSEIRKLRNTE